MALDGGSPALSATQVLTVLVLDVNDESPVFLQQLYETAVYENQDPGELVVRVEAVDRDAGNFNLFCYCGHCRLIKSYFAPCLHVQTSCFSQSNVCV